MDRKLYKLMDWARIEQIVYSEEDKPHEYLGARNVKGGVLVNAFIPAAKAVSVLFTAEGVTKEYKTEQVDEEGFFSTLIKDAPKSGYSYKLRILDEDGNKSDIYDPYSFESTINDKELELFNLGINYNVYDYLGAHVRTINNVEGVSFAVWAPNALRVSVVGDFNDWDGRTHQMRRLGNSGVFEIFIPNIPEGSIYKYELKLKGGLISLKADPYGFGSQLRPDSASVVRDLSGFEWTDDNFIKSRDSINSKDKPISIYELYLGSFLKSNKGEFPNYRDLAKPIADYVNKMGYTHIELMPIMEHPLDESWGYQVLGYYAVTARYGLPKDFMYFVNYMHENGIGVILDWVPAHFPRDIQGLSAFDGTCLYEHEDPRLANHPHWGTLCFNYGRAEVSNYLIANALYWIKEYHADGIRIDAVASMLYRDYGRSDGEWIPNVYGGKENLEAIELIKHLNSINKKMETGAMIIAEESTAFYRVTGALNEDGLGFDYKWNMGWMNDYLDFIRQDPLFRSGRYGELTFSMIYAYSEQFMLVFSHDEVVHGKASLIAKMPGDRDKQFANVRASFGYMFTHPGKKLSFMGMDIGEYEEWNEKRIVNWDLLNVEEHKRLNHYIADLNSIYKENPALYELDNNPDGFEWINNISANETIIVFLRKDNEGNNLLIVCNFADSPRNDYKIGVPFEGMYKEIFNSDAEKYGGFGIVNPRVKSSKKSECDGREDSIKIKVPPLSVMIFKCIKKEDYEKFKKATK